MGYDKKRFAELLEIAKGNNRSINKYGMDSNVDPGYISRLLRCLVDTPPSANVIKKLAEKAYNGVTINNLMAAAGYLEEEVTNTPSTPMPENLPPLLQDLDPELVRKFYEAMNDPLEELFFDDILSASKEEREELIREFLILRKERKKHQK